MRQTDKNGFTLVELLVVIGILGILMGALFPAISNAMMQANMTAMGMRGKDVYVSITGANTEREALGLGSVWPRTKAAEGEESEDIAAKGYSDAVNYFNDLYDAKNLSDAKAHSPYVQGFDFGKLAGGDAKAPIGGAELKANNLAWSIAANIQDSMEDIIPVLVTRNLSCGDLLLKYSGATSAGNKADIKVGTANGGDSDIPFANKGFVLIRKGGAIVKTTARYARYDVIYQKQSFELPEATPEMDALAYLTATGKDTPTSK